MSDIGHWDEYEIPDLEDRGIISLGRGNIISKIDIQEKPGGYPIYSSSAKGDGMFGKYGDYMFDEEMITWSIDGGGTLFYRPKHKFSVTNVCGYMRLDTSVLDYRFVHAALCFQHSRVTFDYQTKAHPSVIRNLYRIPIPPLPEQKKVAEILSGIDNAIEASKNLLQKLLDLKVAIIDEFCSDASSAQVDSLPLAETVESDAPICYGILMPGHHFPGGVPVVKVKNILNGSIVQDDLLLTDPEIDMKYERSRIAANDLLVTIRGSTGRTAFVPRNLNNANITQDTARVRVRGDINRELVRFYIDSSSGQKYIEDHTIGQAVKGINLADLRSMPVPLKVLDSPKEFASAVSAIGGRVSLLSAKVVKLKSQKEAITNDLLSGRKRVSI